MSHTPGPWHVEPVDWEARPELCDADVEYFSTVYAHTEEGYDFIVADMCGTATGSYAQGCGEANARLIAAAPAMYDYVSKKADEGDAEAATILEGLYASR